MRPKGAHFSGSSGVREALNTQKKHTYLGVFFVFMLFWIGETILRPWSGRK